MAQIRSKQIKDFLSTVNWATVTQSAIPNASDVKTYVDGQVSNVNASNTSLETRLDSELSAEISATNSDVTALQLANSNEESRAIGKEGSLETAISVEEDRIDAILDVVGANPDSFADVVALINSVDTENDNALATVILNLNNEIAATNGDVNVLTAADSTEKLRAETAEGLIDGRVTTLLAGKTEALDTFGEIRTFIEALSTEDVTTIEAISTAVSNDVVHAAAISTGISVAIANDTLAQGYADDAQAAAESTAAQNAVEALAIVKAADDAAAEQAVVDAQAVIDLAIALRVSTNSYADTAEADAVASAKAYANGLAVNYDASGSAAAALLAAKSDASAKDDVILSTLRGEIADLGAIDKLEQLAGGITAAGFRVAEAVSDENFDILVFVNGLQIHRSSESVDGFSTSNGSDFIVSGLGYDLDAEDHVVVIGSRA